MKSKYDWLGFGVNFILGAILGGLIGLWGWVHSELRNSSTGGLLYIGLGVLLGGIIAGLLRDRFWKWIGFGGKKLNRF